MLRTESQETNRCKKRFNQKQTPNPFEDCTTSERDLYPYRSTCFSPGNECIYLMGGRVSLLKTWMKSVITIGSGLPLIDSQFYFVVDVFYSNFPFSPHYFTQFWSSLGLKSLSLSLANAWLIYKHLLPFLKTRCITFLGRYFSCLTPFVL